MDAVQAITVSDSVGGYSLEPTDHEGFDRVMKQAIKLRERSMIGTALNTNRISKAGNSFESLCLVATELACDSEYKERLTCLVVYMIETFFESIADSFLKSLHLRLGVSNKDRSWRSKHKKAGYLLQKHPKLLDGKGQTYTELYDYVRPFKNNLCGLDEFVENGFVVLTHDAIKACVDSNYGEEESETIAKVLALKCKTWAKEYEETGQIVAKFGFCTKPQRGLLNNIIKKQPIHPLEALASEIEGDDLKPFVVDITGRIIKETPYSRKKILDSTTTYTKDLLIFKVSRKYRAASGKFVIRGLSDYHSAEIISFGIGEENPYLEKLKGGEELGILKVIYRKEPEKKLLSL